MSQIIGKLATKFLLPGLGLKELVDLIRGNNGEDVALRAQNLADAGVTSRFAIVDLQNDVVIKFISAKKALLMSTTRRRRRPTVTKFVSVGGACPPQVIK